MCETHMYQQKRIRKIIKTIHEIWHPCSGVQKTDSRTHFNALQYIHSFTLLYFPLLHPEAHAYLPTVASTTYHTKQAALPPP